LAHTSVDFNYVGNTENVNGILKSANINANNTASLNFTTSLRKWAPICSFKA